MSAGALRRRATPALLALAAVAATGTAVVYRVFVRSQTGQLVEAVVRKGKQVGEPPLLPRLPQILAVVSVSSLALALAVAVAVGMLRARWRSALAAGVIVATSTVTTEVLKNSVLLRPDFGNGSANSLPSGHTTVAASVAVAAVLVAPRRLRVLVAVAGCAYAVATGIATVVADWHRPSDVLAAYGVVLTWSALVAAGVTALWPTPPDAGLASRPQRATALILASSALPLAAFAVALMLTTASHANRPVGDIRRFSAYAGSLSGITAACMLMIAIWLIIVPLVDDARGRAIAGVRPAKSDAARRSANPGR